MLLVDLPERFRARFHALRASQQQIAVRVQSVVKCGQHLLLERDAQIDQKIAATNEIHPGERRIAGDVLNRKDTNIAHLLADLIAAAGFGEKFLQAFRGNIGGDILRIMAVARHLNGLFADVGREDLNGRRPRTMAGDSSNSMAMEYASSPVAQPGTQTRMGKSPWLCFKISGITWL